MKERKIGEIFEFGGEWYQCLKSPDGSCKHCDMDFEKCPIPVNECTENGRSDKSYVIFKKLEKVGGILGINKKTYQCIKPIYHKGCTGCAFDRSCRHICSGQGIYVEIKQNKEDMEEKKLNLKPFDLEAAKSGKPVCTRDGRKARIVCFDAKGKQPIIALFVREKADEVIIQTYNDDGSYYGLEKEDNRDLMMLPEKKEGWVNLYKSSAYSTKEEAMKYRNKCNDYIDTIKISWEE